VTVCFCEWSQTSHELKGGGDPQDTLSCRSSFTKEPWIIGLLCGKWPMKTRHPMHLCHSVSSRLQKWERQKKSGTHAGQSLLSQDDVTISETCRDTWPLRDSTVSAHWHPKTSNTDPKYCAFVYLQTPPNLKLVGDKTVLFPGAFTFKIYDTELICACVGWRSVSLRLNTRCCCTIPVFK